MVEALISLVVMAIFCFAVTLPGLLGHVKWSNGWKLACFVLGELISIGLLIVIMYLRKAVEG